MSNDRLKEWLRSDSKFIKIKVGERYESLFKSMKFDETGGFKGKPTVKYFLQDLKDGKERELSSSSKVLADQMMKMKEGDKIAITASLNDRETKVYSVVRIGVQAEQTEIKVDEGEVDPNLIPF